jgi:DNA repair exonuclease SbcCD ATPase subunit
MSETTAPIEVDQIDCAPLGRAKIAVRITGRWRSRRRVPDTRAFLVIEAEGRRHRFPAMPEARRPRIGRPGSWAATFALPSWLEPHLAEAMSLWIGDVVIPLARPSFVPQLVDAPAEASTAEIDEDPEAVAEAIEHSEPLEREPPVAEIVTEEHGGSVPRSPKPGEVDGWPSSEPENPAELQATIDALRAELRQRAATEAQLRGELAGTKAELDGRSVHQAALEATQAELRDQLAELLELAEREGAQRAEVESRAMVLAGELAELQERLAELTSSRDQVARETGSLRAELERAAREALHLRDELVQLRAVAEEEGAGRVLLEARTGELSQQLQAVRAELAQREVARDAALGDAAGLRDELERLGAELSQVRGRGVTDNGLSEAKSLLDEARAATARLRGDH